MGEPAPALASPVTGAGAKVTAVEQLLLDASSMGVPIAAMAGGEDIARFRDGRCRCWNVLVWSDRADGPLTPDR